VNTIYIAQKMCEQPLHTGVKNPWSLDQLEPTRSKQAKLVAMDKAHAAFTLK